MLSKILEGINQAGKYDPLYNPRVHGPYDPSRFYGKADKPFLDVRVGELGQWMKNRNKTPYGFVSAVSRGYWAFKLKYIGCKNSNACAILIPVFIVAAINAQEHFHHVFDKTKYH
ncbi:putative ATP synthase subunit f, mitochondrial [Mizuhopecten yessoensis]|uniref:ATP synthase subunit f, mitochondrial n=1 Tax=Mizuhopecten yessoensis TaxID=6573 RepID=A0A210PFJ9_MIZYE|nr:putative ATP synthase subunit f, mitochondrial [Mizuhopecten yessoensis]OWF35237.1 ATP synthase subunit f, mitochondrial [Mizuhopecten yessoensis]